MAPFAILAAPTLDLEFLAQITVGLAVEVQRGWPRSKRTRITKEIRPKLTNDAENRMPTMPNTNASFLKFRQMALLNGNIENPGYSPKRYQHWGVCGKIVNTVLHANTYIQYNVQCDNVLCTVQEVVHTVWPACAWRAHTLHIVCNLIHALLYHALFMRYYITATIKCH